VELDVAAAMGAAIADPANKEVGDAVVAFSAGPLSSALISSVVPNPSMFFTVENKLWSLFGTGLSMCAVLLKPPAPSPIPPVGSSYPGLEAGGWGDSIFADVAVPSAVPLCDAA
jgi:hypothetical protein